MMKPCHMTMPRGKRGQLVRESCEKGSRHGPKFGLRSHEEGIPGGGGRAGWVAGGWLRSPGMGLGSGMVILSWPLDRFLPSFRPNANASSHSSSSSSSAAAAAAISVVIACAAGAGFLLGYLRGWLAWPSSCCCCCCC